MTSTPENRLSILRERIKQQRNTVAALKREGHECADAERQLEQMVEEATAHEKASRSSL